MASRMAGKTNVSVGQFIESMQSLLEILVPALQSIAGKECSEWQHSSTSCLDQLPDVPAAWCPSCTALAALTAAKDWQPEDG